MGPPSESSIDIDQPLLACESRPAAKRSFFDAPTRKLLLAGVLLPNALSLVTLASFIDIGLPPRTSAIALYGIVALCARRMPLKIVLPLFLAVLAFDLVWTISLMFGLAPTELLVALEHARRINLLASPLYVGLIVAVCGTSIISMLLLAQRAVLMRGNVYILCAAVLATMAADAISNTSAHFQFNAMFGRERPVISSADVSGFNDIAGTNGRNVVMVVVESLGYMTDAAARQRIAAPLFDRKITDRYTVTSGHAEYFGSTTSGEMRELCDTRTSYQAFPGQSGSSCLPAVLRRRGYSTLAFHGFSSGMFERHDWYPQIGFGKAVFGEELQTRSARRCGNAFRSVCDADLAPLIAKEAASKKSPHFIYWLTLNTHVPVPPGDALTNFNCTKPDHGFGVPSVCRMAELWHDLFTSVGRLALDPAIGPAEILIVGDHAPPLWSKRGRGQFAPGQVAWYRLTPKASVSPAASALPLN